jgi:tetratricopeptide (TPR) repeat protein
MAEAFMAMPLFVALRVQRFDDVLARPEPDARFPITHALWHFARGLALVASGRPAQTEREALAAAQHDLPAGTMFGLNHAPRILELAALVLDARLAAAAGDANAAIEHWTKAVAINDTLAYDEPADWYYPVRESLGAALLRAGRHTEAEQVFRADLERNPRNGRSLLGLRDSLQAQGRSDDAAWASAAFEAAWRDADLKLRLEDL